MKDIYVLTRTECGDGLCRGNTTHIESYTDDESEAKLYANQQESHASYRYKKLPRYVKPDSPTPKYKIGDEVFWLGGKFKVVSVSVAFGGDYYTLNNADGIERQTHESFLYDKG